MTIATEFAARGGVSGILERLVTSLVVRRIYRKELELLAAYVCGPQPPTAPESAETTRGERTPG